MIPVNFVDEVLDAVHKLEAKHAAAQESLLKGTQANIAKIEVTLREAGIEFPDRQSAAPRSR